VDRVELRGPEALRQVWDEWLTLWESDKSKIVETVERGQRILVVRRNQFRSSRKKGTATITVNAPNPGELVVTGNGVTGASAVGAVSATTVSAPGPMSC
jgi:3-dehydroquinate synthase class II